MTTHKTNPETDKKYPRVWVFDINRRHYRRDENGRSYGSPIYRYHWYEITIVGETSRSWIDRFGKKIPKKVPEGAYYPYCFSEEEINERVYVHDCCRKIAELVRRCDYNQLRKVADIVGFKESE